MNKFNHLLGSRDGIICVGSVRNAERDQEIRYCYSPNRFGSSTVGLVLIDLKTNYVLDVVDTQVFKPRRDNDDRFYYNGGFIKFGHPRANRERIYYSPIARFNELLQLAYDYGDRGSDTRHILTLRERYKGTLIEPMITPNLLVVLNRLRFLPPDADELTSMQAMLALQYHSLKDEEMYIIASKNPRDAYLVQLGMIFSSLMVRGYPTRYADQLDEMMCMRDQGCLVNMFMSDNDHGSSPYATARMWKCPIDEHIRYSNSDVRIMLTDYTKVSSFLGLLQNPFLE